MTLWERGGEILQHWVYTGNGVNAPVIASHACTWLLRAGFLPGASDLGMFLDTVLQASRSRAPVFLCLSVAGRASGTGLLACR